jgi:hypothetical protein
MHLQRKRKQAMKISKWLVGSAFILPFAINAPLVNAQVDPEKLPKEACSSITYSQDFIGKYPKAGAACQEVRVYKGKRYAKFNAKILLKDPAFMTVQVLNVAGDPLDSVTFKPASTGAKLLVNGKPETFAELQVGDPVTFWISENRFSMYSSPGHQVAATGMPPK